MKISAIRIITLVMAVILLMSSAVACAKQDGAPSDTTTAPAADTTPAPSVDTTTATPDTTTAAPEETTVAVTPEVPDDNTLKTTVDGKKTAAPETLKILAIGNSFSTDAMQYLYNMLKSAGVKTIVLGNLYYGGCSLQQHYTFARTDSASYKYYKNTRGSWSNTADSKMSTALADEEWDFITLQQTSKTSGLANSYGAMLTKLVDHVAAACPNATLIWHQTWAYQADSTHSSFPNYDRDQTKMYNMIVDCVKQCIEPEDRIKVLIPCGTAIQNARTSYLGDTLTRDGYHMDYNIGRFITGLTWFCTFTGLDASACTHNPVSSKINADMVKVAVEAVNNAIAQPYSVTESTIKTGEGAPSAAPTVDPSIVLDPADFIEADTALAATKSIDLSKYKLLEWKHLENAYYNSTTRAGTTTPSSSQSTYKQNICCDRKYSLTELPVGTVFICDDGWQYRLEKFQTENAKYTGTRPGMITDNIYVLDTEFVDDCNYFAWNIASNPKSNISAIYAQAAAHLRVYVPVK